MGLRSRDLWCGNKIASTSDEKAVSMRTIVLQDLTIKIQPEWLWYHIEGHDIYRLNCIKAGSFRCCVTDLIFDVNAPVTLIYYFDSWSQNLNEEHRKQWEIVGPLLNIQAYPKEAVAAVHFPHFLCLEGKGCSKIYLAHFGEQGMSLEKPDSVGPYHVELKNLTPCSCGAVLKKSWFEGKIKAHAVTLLYYEHKFGYTTLRFYLLPNDSSLKQAVNERELLSHKVQCPSQTMQPLIIGSDFVLKSTSGFSIYPKKEKLQFKYPPTDRHIQYLELYLEFMEDVLELVLLEDDTNDLVWKAFIKKEELMHANFHFMIGTQTTPRIAEPFLTGRDGAQAKRSLLIALTSDEMATSKPTILLQNFAENIQPETLLDPQGGYNMYRLNCTKTGSFRCCITDLIFDVRAAVTFTYYFDLWSKYLNEEHKKQWDIVGPLLNIQADAKEAVAAVHFPHFLCLQGKGCPDIYLAHFVEEGMRLEKPDSVESYHVELKNPAFSPRGVVFKRTWFKRKIKVHAVALLYQDLRVQSMKLHFYLLPNDSSLKKAVHELELNYSSQRIRKPPEIQKALMIGSCFSLQKMTDVTICPEDLKFKYLDADMEQQYLELHAKDMKDELNIFLIEKDTNEIVWIAVIRKEDLKSTISPPIEGAAAACRPTHRPINVGANPETEEEHLPDAPGMHFIEWHRKELIERTSNVEGVLDMLYGAVLDYEQYQKILSRKTSQDKMRELYMLLPSWNRFCKDQLYEALKVKQKYLIEDLEDGDR
nr:caspase recruitment domain-containing protein 8-like [Anolis sagrei ordinatus]